MEDEEEKKQKKNKIKREREREKEHHSLQDHQCSIPRNQNNKISQNPKKQKKKPTPLIQTKSQIWKVKELFFFYFLVSR